MFGNKRSTQIALLEVDNKFMFVLWRVSQLVRVIRNSHYEEFMVFSQLKIDVDE